MIDFFKYPVMLGPYAQLWLLWPLLAAVAIIYKALRAKSPRTIPLETIKLLGYMAGGVIVLGAVLWAINSFWP